MNFPSQPPKFKKAFLHDKGRREKSKRESWKDKEIDASLIGVVGKSVDLWAVCFLCGLYDEVDEGGGQLKSPNSCREMYPADVTSDGVPREFVERESGLRS